MSQAIETSIFRRLRPWAALRTVISNWRKRRRLHDLQRLDDHVLKDIGLTRDDVHRALGQPLSVDPVRDLKRVVRLRCNAHLAGTTRRWLNDRAFDHPRINMKR